jgi:hypothetical protein
MDAGRRRWARTWLSLVALLVLSRAGWCQALPAGQVVPVAVADNRRELVLPTDRPDDKFYLIIGSLARNGGPYRVVVRTAATDSPVSLPVENIRYDADWARRIGDLNERLARARREGGTVAYPPAADPPRRRTFHVFVKENDFGDASGYVAVTGELRGVGRHCQVYVDCDHADAAGLQPTVDDVIAFFDGSVYPKACARLGRTLDVDRDGRFTVLFSDWLARMSGGKVALGGFVRGSDFYRDLPAPFSNHCDMLYLNADLKPGPHLHTLLAHEYTHAVVFSEHVFGGYLSEVPGQDEENWLNEALAHLAEDMHGVSWSNLDYRVSAFLSAPERYPLVVPDYYGARLWRTHGVRGATYLFLRWCVDRHGPELARRLIQTSQHGVANLETATGEHFALLFRQWSAALALSGSGLLIEGVTPLRHIDPRQPLASRLLCGPRFDVVPLDGAVHEVKVAGTAAAYLLLHSPAGARSRVTITAETGTDMQVSLVRLPEQTGRLSLRFEASNGEGQSPDGSIRLIVTAHDAGATLTAAAWERLTPKASDPADTSYRPDTPAGAMIRAWFGDPCLKAGETRRSVAIKLPEEDGPVVFKIAGTDSAGHTVSAWLVYPRDVNDTPARRK